jgi:nicotinamide-nucleotide amidase
VVVTGSELVRGERTDLNGPFFAQEALRLGLQPVRIAIVGDDPGELEAALSEGFEADVCLVSGGLGPTHDDRTIELVARVAGRSLRLHEELEVEIEQISRRFAERMRRPYADFAAGVRKQATLPEGGISLGIAGTAPGVVLDTGSCVVVVLPGPPGELQRLWPRAIETDPMRRVLAQTTEPGRRVLRFFGASESAVAKALADAGGDGDGVEITICARDFEIHVDLIVEPGAEERADALESAFLAPIEEYLFVRDERSVQELVLERCRAARLTLGTAESCTGGLAAGRLTSIPGSSDVFRGGIVAYDNGVKETLLGVSPGVLESHGAVSAEAAAAMAEGARERLGVDVAVAVTGIAGPGGGTPEKPVGLVFVHAAGPTGERALRLEIPGEREWVRARSTVTALHLVRRLLESDG